MSKSKTRDYFAELYVSGLFADAGWNVYFPHRDQGFDFIATKAAGKSILIRPVQVKGKYPESEKTNKPTYGYSGKLTAIHEQMVLAIPFFSTAAGSKSPLHTAFMPLSKIKQTVKGFRCHPAHFAQGTPIPRRDSKSHFDSEGLVKIENSDWH